MQEIAGKVALVTGAGSGIGLGIARALAAEGAKLAVVDIDAEAAERAAAELQAKGAAALALHLDVSDEAAWERVANTVENELGPVAIEDPALARPGPLLGQGAGAQRAEHQKADKDGAHRP